MWCFFSDVLDDVDGAFMDGFALDSIRVASNSFIQSFTEYHYNPRARLTALQNLRVGRPQVWEGTKRATTGSLRQVRLSAGKKGFLFPCSSQEQCMKRCGQVYLRSTSR